MFGHGQAKASLPSKDEAGLSVELDGYLCPWMPSIHPSIPSASGRSGRPCRGWATSHGTASCLGRLSPAWTYAVQASSPCHDSPGARARSNKKKGQAVHSSLAESRASRPAAKTGRRRPLRPVSFSTGHHHSRGTTAGAAAATYTGRTADGCVWITALWGAGTWENKRRANERICRLGIPTTARARGAKFQQPCRGCRAPTVVLQILQHTATGMLGIINHTPRLRPFHAKGAST